MTISKMPPPKIAQTIDVLRWTMSGDDADAATETRRRARLCGPDAVAFLSFVMRSDRFASSAQRVRSATVLLEAGGFLSSEAKATGLFRDDDADGLGTPEAG
jgi:hypothetical protein